MKKVLLIVILCSAFQTTFAQYKGGLEFGGNIMNADFTLSPGGEVDTKSSWGIRLGYVAEYYVTDQFYLRGAVLVNQRGFFFDNERWGLNALDIPVNLGYAFPVKDEMKVFIDGGVNVEYNFHAFTKIDNELVELTIGGDEQDIKPISIGVNFGTGYQFSEKWKFRVNYYKGLTNLVRTDGDEWTNSVVGFAFDFFF